MTEKIKIINKDELNAILSDRVSMDYNSRGKRINCKEINEKIILHQRISHNSNTYILTLIFDECTFNEPVDIGVYENAGEVKFNNCTFNNTVKIQFENSSFSGTCIFNSDLNIHNSINSELEIFDYTVQGEFKISGLSQKLYLYNINLGQKIKEQVIKISGEFREILIEKIYGKTLKFSNNVIVNGEFKITNIEVFELILGTFTLNTQMKIDNCKIANLQIEKVKGENKALEIMGSDIGKVELQMDRLLKTSIIESSFQSLKLFDANEEDSILNIEKTSIINLEFERVLNKGLITLRELNIPMNGIVKFKSSNLGKADFIYCNFSKATLEFENSKITEAFFSETEFPKKVLVDGKRNYGQAQLTFGQLATAFQKQGDNIRALEYNSRELEAHYKNIRLLSPAFFQKINLWLNAISNNFGRNWFRGTIFSFGIGILFFCFLLVSTKNYSWGFPEFDFNLIPAYLKFMNPLRFFELEALFNNTSQEGIIKLNGLSYLADFGGRIFIAYGYYQTIQAFRRFGRK